MCRDVIFNEGAKLCWKVDAGGEASVPILMLKDESNQAMLSPTEDGVPEVTHMPSSHEEVG